MDSGRQSLLIILVIAMLIFGAEQLPKLARSLGEASKEFKKGLVEGGRRHPAEDSTSSSGDRDPS